jgi:hypothetical protein
VPSGPPDVQQHNVSVVKSTVAFVNGINQIVTRSPSIVPITKRPMNEQSNNAPPRVAAQQENSTLFIVLGIVCGTILVGLLVLLFVCIRRQKQQRVLIGSFASALCVFSL